MVTNDTENPFDEIIDIGIISPGGAIPVDWDFFTLVNQTSEFMDRHLRPLPWTIGCEDPQTGDIHPIKMMIRIAEEFTRPFGGSVRGDGLDIEVLFRERDPLVFSINRGGGSKNEVFDFIRFTSFQKDNRSTDVYILVEEGICNRGPYPSPGSQVDDEINSVFLEDPFKVIRLSDIPCDELKQVLKFLYHPFRIFDFYIGIIKAVKVIKTNHFDPIT
jgi:hypothetical protein